MAKEVAAENSEGLGIYHIPGEKLPGGETFVEEKTSENGNSEVVLPEYQPSAGRCETDEDGLLVPEICLVCGETPCALDGFKMEVYFCKLHVVNNAYL